MRGRRPFTYVILAINALFLIWLIAGVGSATGDVPDDCYPGMAKYWADCGDALIAARIEVAMKIILFWGFVDTILGFVWSVTTSDTRRRRLQSPHLQLLLRNSDRVYP